MEEVNVKRKDTKPMSPFASPMQAHHQRTEGIAVVGEAVRRVAPESAEFVMEITANAPTAAQAVRDNHLKTTQVTQAVGSAGVQPADLQTISLNVHNIFSPGPWGSPPALPGYGNVPQIGQGVFSAYSAGAHPFGGPAGAAEVQLGSYCAKNTLRVSVREPGRVGEVADAATRAGATILGAFSFKASDDAGARRAALEAAARDARAKAETLATAAGKQVGEPVAIAEEVVASNGAYLALRSVMPFALGAGAPHVVGDLEYYARVSASFRFQER